MSSAGVSAAPTQVGYNAIWEKTSAPRPWIAGWTFQDFVKKNTELQNAGFQVVSVSAFMLPEGARYNAVWDKLPSRPAGDLLRAQFARLRSFASFWVAVVARLPVSLIKLFF